MSYTRLYALARHVPPCVLSELITAPDASFPRAKIRTGAVLFLDISGFTVLSQSLPVHRLSHHINAYFSLLIDEIHQHGGQVVKFAGDALFAVWFDADEVGYSSTAAARCGASVVSLLDGYQIEEESKALSLGIRGGCGYGEIRCLHVGNEKRAEFLISGSAVLQAAAAETAAADTAAAETAPTETAARTAEAATTEAETAAARTAAASGGRDGAGERSPSL